MSRNRITTRPLAFLSLLAVAAAALGAQPPTRAAQTPASAPDRLVAAMHGISSNVILDYVKELTAEKYGGRLTGTAGYDAAAAWTVDLLRGWGYQPMGDQGSWYQKFPNPYTLVLPGTELSLQVQQAGGGTIVKSYVWEKEFYQGSTSDSGRVTAEAVYVGYGVTAPELGYDDYAGMDVKGKIVVVEPEAPMGPMPDTTLFKKWRPYSFHSYKIENAAKHGAIGMVYDYHIANPNARFVKGLILTYVSGAVLDDLFAGLPMTHRQTLDQIRQTLKPASRVLGKTMTLANNTQHHPEGIGANVIGVLPGSDPALKDEYIVLGAHLDHLGYNHELMPGAHDNASGVAVLLAAAEAITKAKVPMKRSVLLLLFGAEEQGVAGSEYYVAHPVVPNAKITAFLNLESVGRGERIGVSSGVEYPAIYQAMERADNQYVHRAMGAYSNLNLARPRQDAAHFLWAKIPTVSIGTSGAPPLPYASYHTTKDTWQIMTPEVMEDLARITFMATVDLANR